MDRSIGSTENARTAREVVLVDPITGAPAPVGGTGAAARQVQGPAADNAAAVGNPVWVGAKHFASTQTYADGDLSSLQANANGILMVGAPSSSAVDAVPNTLTYMNDKAGGARPLAIANFAFNGTSWDRARTVSMAPTGTRATGEPPWATSDLTPSRIDVAAAGDNVLVAAVPSQTTRVHRLRLSPANSVVIQIKDGATVLETFNYTAGGPCISLDFSARPHYRTTVGTALNIHLSGAVQVDGRIEYVTSA